ncbi:hypothetical protein FLM9_760 [Candidatus Synechococcus spongiarum]|uniref:Uncharacterized protein n=1 Tax=Candidatus Synechococcus spongiarum TaxID=431041 RepID=A0A164Z4P2_9SYNE|nr:hypothetical protein FLM9_760 [Candidatus Synechococcus spongiarum]
MAIQPCRSLSHPTCCSTIHSEISKFALPVRVYQAPGDFEK